MNDLPGLSAFSPIGFLGALGLLRVLSEDRSHEVKLGWRDGHAVIDGLEPEAILSEVMENMGGRAEAPEFCWTDSTRKVSPYTYRHVCNSLRGNSRALGFMAGWATDSVIHNDFVAVTRMDMTSGNQKLIHDLRNLADRITEEHMEAALFGGAYEEQSAYGLDPTAVRSHAHEPKAPSGTKPLSKPGLVWLAFESIPLHPVLPISPFRRHTTGWRMSIGPIGYLWPIWTGLLSLQEVFYLRSLPLERLPERPEVKEVWFSQYGQSGKYGMLLPAQREH